MNKGKLYLIPTPLGEGAPLEVLPASVLDLLPTLRRFVVEEVRTARRFLSSAGLKGHIQELEFHELNEHTSPAEVEALMALFADGSSVGLLSEAGLPAVADPGAQLVALCHRHQIEVVPLVGPSSLMLALMASGLNGQSFAFVGYIPAKTEERRAALRALEKRSASASQTQILIETPYRNDSLLADMLQCLSAGTRLCLAANLTCPDAFIRTRTIAQWKQEPVTIGKRPCVFVILSEAKNLKAKHL
ncbi:MAG: SAM-dependent methyltransferase [Bacteroidales bacterium]|nr:SAM-dependent methyltransferase [Bacteroidales bacterium]